MSYEQYTNALKSGQKEYRARLTKGYYPYLPVLDEILSYTKVEYEVNIGLCEIPLELIVGTKTRGRTNSFAANFMPLLDTNTEFAAKWISLHTNLLEEGLRDPVKAYEFMGRFYVMEGNKRVSVLKFLDAYSVPCSVIRVVPKRNDTKENAIYFEFMDFYEVTGIYSIYFSEKGRFAQFLEQVGTPKGARWTSEDRQEFDAVYTRFRKVFESKGGGKLPITVGDALLTFLTVFGYEETKQKSAQELKRDLTQIWDEFVVLTEEQSIELRMDPPRESASPNRYRNLLNLILPDNSGKVKIAFLYEKTHRTSGWTYSHELGRLYLDNVFPGQIETTAFENIVAGENDQECMEEAIRDGHTMLFTTSPVMMPASLKIAAKYPEVKVLNCSLNTSHPTLRTYYARMYEAKFLAGIIAGSMATTDKIGYIADYPIYGMAANINAFAMGARMVNPHAKVYLDWSTLKQHEIDIRDNPEIEYVMGQDMTSPDKGSRHFGLYHINGEIPDNLAMTTWHWGKLYEKIIRIVLNGTWKEDAAAGSRATSYWWGISAGVVDLICSQDLPRDTRRLVDLLRNNICSDTLIPFSGDLCAQDGTVMNTADQVIPPQDIITMDWLLDNVVGSIPKISDLTENAQAVAKMQGLDKTQETDA
ncbi:MAG: BMP family ABC transporter substrate-binding protein [Eubacterium sp.]|nr:BMP family ABC transporter substrate-binding protein [Eubacterium sp.]MCM1216309.1 BMP family ABC transporter substrate-binding protein [Lachnospiraceae bacterium]MCM1240076.1 BMP family ABC transporter substrate-binding protein [Lachnospiraceae bacterium]